MTSGSFFDDEPPVFTVRWRGYDRFQVDDYLRNPTGPPRFDLVLRGYDQREVDDHLRRTPP